MDKKKDSSGHGEKRQSEAKALIDSMIDPVISITAKGTIESVNPAFTAMFGYAANEVIGKNVKMLMPEPYHGEHDGYLADYKKGGDKKVIGIGREVVAQRKDGSTFPIHLSVSEYRVGEEAFYTGIIRDLTAILATEQEVRDSQAKMRELINTALDPIITITDRGSIESVNPAFSKMFGYSDDDVIGKNVKMLMPEPFHAEHDGYLSNYQRTGDKKIIGSGREVVAQRKDGSTFPIHLSVSEYLVGGGKFFAGSIRDLTDINKSKAYLEGLVSQAEVISSGDFSVEINPQDQSDKLGMALQRMVRFLQGLASQADRIAAGDYNADITPQSDRDKLGVALQKMMAKLRSVTDSNARQIWISQGVSGLHEVIRGETDIRKMATTLCQYLAKYLQAQIITFYVADDNKLRLVGSYAFNKRKSLGDTIEFGEGLVGQAALEQQTISVTDIPEGYTRIGSSIGNASPGNIVITPFVFADTVLGVLELGVFTELSDLKLELLDALKESVAIIIQRILAQNRTQDLLEKTQRQTDELKAQQEELSASNESLQEQALRLKASEEELKQQSEELQATNEELSEKQIALKKKNDQVEMAKAEVETNARELALASRYKSEFLANMSHELRTPLNSLLLLSKSLSNNKTGNLTEDQIEDVKIIHEGGNDLLTLISDIMDLSKVEAGMLNILPGELRLEALTHNLRRVFEPVAADRGLTFLIEIDGTLPDFIISDSQRLEQILKNLLSNAMKFTEKGSVSLTIEPIRPATRFRQSDLSRETAIAFTVVDTGVGIPIDKQKAIFEAFQQQDGSISRKYGGTGLGLTISRELARLLGGEIQLQSCEHEGSTFTLYLPKELKPESVVQTGTRTAPATVVVESTLENTHQADASQFDLDRSGQSFSSEPLSSELYATQFIVDDRQNILEDDKTLLIIDDDKSFASILRDYGIDNGYKCLVAGDGRSGIYLASKYKPDGILLDIELPDIDGLKVLEQLKYSLHTRHIPIQIISCNSDDQSQYLNQGAVGYLIKPVKEEQLNTALKNITAIASADIKSILIVEDDKGSQKALATILEDNGTVIKGAIKGVGTGKEACAEILSATYDCVILDIGLPDMSGFDVLHYVNGHKTQTLPPIIIYTGREITDQEQADLEKYAATTVVKSVGSPERLLDNVSLFMHSIESNFASERKNAIHALHDEDAMLKDRKVLLVDDDMRNMYALSKQLLGVGLQVNMAKHGQDAVELLKQDSTYELVFMDIMMPVMDGYEATRLIRQMPDYSDIPIIALTAKVMQEDRNKCLQAGVSEYLAKPIDFEKLLSILRIWLFKHS